MAGASRAGVCGSDSGHKWDAEGSRRPAVGGQKPLTQVINVGIGAAEQSLMGRPPHQQQPRSFSAGCRLSPALWSPCAEAAPLGARTASLGCMAGTWSQPKEEPPCVRCPPPPAISLL